jgi:NAD(P)-dependent dehydrogenase (short-subunit alcohol dehydrogenase family)
MRLNGKTALVTGSTKGIGVQIAARFAAEGARVLVTGRSQAAGEEVAERIRKDGGTAQFVAGDISRPEDVRAVVEACVETFGGLDVLVNNAAPIDLMGKVERPLCDMTMDGFDSMLRVGLYGAVAATQAVLPEMLRAGGGAIVNISSIAGVQGVSGVPAYSCVKGALQSFTRQVAVDYGKQGVRSNCIVVGPIAHVGIVGSFFENPVVKSAFEKVMLTKDSRLGEADDIAEAAVYLASDGARFVNGALLPVDGGMTCLATLPNIGELLAQQQFEMSVDELVVGGLTREEALAKLGGGAP